MKVLITGNRNKDLTKYLVPLLESKSYEVDAVSRANGWDLGNTEVINDFVNLLDKVGSEQVFVTESSGTAM